ncbi:uncharacterized protein Tco025E_06346 [Trypanosoma conorhini]|uniref:Uncharacterized protein n=1 Tax=Trypanosoma conorhini TaxID=83891 RepID=A0A3S5IST8_9TRYP|nr:uncharacterized protein Tco025E_06346 [Trypanosoma conorhini]RNF13316.1 hypothetical protein Tco025E_06346 [Trypanosoma conorhini]
MQGRKEVGEATTRVFVNNQNTPFATVTIPTSPPREREKRFLGDSVYAELKRDTFASLGKGDKDSTGVAGLTSLRRNVRNMPGIMMEDVHPQLEDVYQRVMRRLQRKANYDEIGCPSLAVQFGIVDPTDEERSREKNEHDSDEPHTSAHSSSSNGAHVKTGAPRRKQRGRGLPRSAVLNSTGSDAEDDTFFLSQQPCPKTLRMVLEQVNATVTEKLRLADTGSLKNCLCFVFECRTMLERLLKEIPSYSQFQGEGERLPTAPQMQEMYQEFRRVPVVLPSAQFEKEASNGRVVASVLYNGLHPQSSLLAAGGEPSQPRQPEVRVSADSTPVNAGEDSAFETPGFEAGGEPPKVAHLGGVAIVIPPTYGKSMRTQQNGGRPMRAGAGMESRGNARFFGADTGRATSAVHPLSRDEPLDRKGAEEPAPILAASTTSNQAAPAVARNSGSVSTSGMDAAATAGAIVNSLLHAERERLVKQVFSVATLTDINNMSVVNREDYDELQAYARTLVVEIEERKQEVRALQEQLNEEREYTTQKRKVVQYLRETLYKECNILRSQLSVAQQKQIQYQSLLKEQQQALAHAASAMNAEGRGGTSVSTHEVTRLPNISSARFAQNEASVMGLSLAPGVQSFRRANLNVSAVSMARGSVNMEENEEGNSSVVAGSVSALTPSQRFSVEITAIQSLLDLVLLAVENDQVLPANAVRGKNVNTSLLANTMRDDEHHREEKLRNEFSERQREAKQNYSLGRAQMATLLSMKEQQIENMKKFSDMQFLGNYWEEKCSVLRSELRRIRKAVQEDLSTLKQFLVTTMETIIKRVYVVDSSLGENQTLFATQSALRDVISSAHSLLLPMLTTEYERGYHPWPLKLRNTMDPFSRMIKARYGDAQMILVREEMNALSSLYVAVHHYVMKNVVSPVLKRPLPGKTLRNLCALMSMNNGTSAELWTQIRVKYTRELGFQKSIAELNMLIVSLMYRQRIITERSAEAMQRAGMDPRLSGIPVQRTVNRIAERLHKAVADRAALRKRRQENARDVYRIWKKQQLDVYEGYPPPTPPQRLVVAEMDPHKHDVLLTAPPIVPRSKSNLETPPALSTSQPVNFWNRMLSTSVEGRWLMEEGAPPSVEENLSRGEQELPQGAQEAPSWS